MTVEQHNDATAAVKMQGPLRNNIFCATKLATFSIPVQIIDQDMTIVVVSFVMNQDKCAHRETGKG